MSAPTRLQRYAARLPLWVGVGALSGIVVGLCIGEVAAVLRPIGEAYALMLESVVYPFLFSSLIGSLGQLAPGQAWRLAKASWAVYLFLWIVTFAAILALGAAIPAPPPPTEIVAGAAASHPSIIALLIPGNIIGALFRGYVPAVVIFAVAFGLAIQRVDGKANLLAVLEVIRRGSLAIWNWIVYLAPFGVFALFATTAGTIGPREAEELAIYLVLFFAGIAILAFVVLPMALSALVPERPLDLVKELRPAILIAVVTTLSVAALPLIEAAADRVLGRLDTDEKERREVIRATASIGYVFVQLGNYFIGLFVIYAAFLYRVHLDLQQTILLPFFTLLSGIGSPSTTPEAVQFLANWLHLPDTALPLYIESMAITRYGQVVLSVVAFGFVAVAIPAIYFRRARWRSLRWTQALTTGVLALGLVTVGGRLAADMLLHPAPAGLFAARLVDPLLTRDVEAIVHRELPPDLATVAGAATLRGIRDRGVLRVGYGSDIVPFTYFNRRGDLAGFDVSYAYELAADLHVRLEFYPVNWPTLDADIARHLYDMVMAGAYLTDERIRTLAASAPYFVSPVAVITRAARAMEFLDYAAIRSRSDLTLGVFRDPVLVPLAHHLFPRARVVLLPNYEDLDRHSEIDAALWSLVQARAWAIAHAGFTAVAPANAGSPLVFAYLLPPASTDVASFLDLWLSLHKENGFRDEQTAYWITNTSTARRSPRWSLIGSLFARSQEPEEE